MVPYPSQISLSCWVRDNEGECLTNGGAHILAYCLLSCKFSPAGYAGPILAGSVLCLLVHQSSVLDFQDFNSSLFLDLFFSVIEWCAVC